MEYGFGTEGYYKKMLELQEKLRKSEEERLKLEEKFHEIMQQSRDSEHERLRIMRHKYHKFLEEDKLRQERNENILRSLDRIESHAKMLAAKTDRFKAFRKQYFENYLKRISLSKQKETSNITHSQYIPPQPNVRRKLFFEQPTNESVEAKLALLEQYLRDNFDNFPEDYPTTKLAEQNGINENRLVPPAGATRHVYDKNYYGDKNDISDEERQEILSYDKYLPRKINKQREEKRELLGNTIEKELERMLNKQETEPNNNSLDAKEINSEQFIKDYKNLVAKSEEKYGLKNDLVNKELQQSNGHINIFDNINKTVNIAGMEKLIEKQNKLEMDKQNQFEDKLKSDLLEQEENSDATKAPTDVSLNLSSSSQRIGPELDKEEIQENQGKTISHDTNEYEDDSRKTEENVSIIETQENKLQKQLLQNKEEITDSNQLEKHEKSMSNDQVTFESVINEDLVNVMEDKTKILSETDPPDQQKENYQQQPAGDQLEKDTQKYSQREEQKKHHVENNSEIDFENQYVQQPLPNEFGELVYDQQPKQIIEQEYPSEAYQTQAYQQENYPEQEYQQQEYPESQYQQEGYDQQPNEAEQVAYDEQLYQNSEHYVEGQQDYVAQQDVTGQEVYDQQQYPNSEQYVQGQQDDYAAQDVTGQEVYDQQQYPNSEQYVQGQQDDYAAQHLVSGQEIHDEQNPDQYVENQEYQQQEYPAQNETEQVYDEQPQYQNPEQQQEYQQGEYPQEEVYDPQNYPEGYDNTQPEYISQEYPERYEEQYSEQPQEYTPEQQLQFEQQYGQVQPYPDQQQYVENSAEYDAQAYTDNVYQTGQEYLDGEQNIDMNYQTEQQNAQQQNVQQQNDFSNQEYQAAQEYQEADGEGYVEQDNQQKIKENAEISEKVSDSSEISALKQQIDDKPLVQKTLPNLADMLDTDTSESVKQDTKVSNESDFDFSNT